MGEWCGAGGGDRGRERLWTVIVKVVDLLL